MKSVLGYLLLALIVATVIGFSAYTLTNSKHTDNPSLNTTNTTKQTGAPTPTQTQPSNLPAESGCPQEGHIKSPSSFDKATITFDNQTAGDLKVYWIDFNGNRKFYSNLKAHAKYNQATWVGHVWVVANGDNQCIKLESANSVLQTLEIK